MNLPSFHQQPTLLRATFHINTPMFVAGANPKEVELTPTSFKGVMRFWWRALNWSQIRLGSADKTSALKKLHEQEAQLFGLASGNNKGGQGDCLVNTLKLISEREWQLPQNRQGINYLLGQGLSNRFALTNNQTFTIDLTVTENAKNSVYDVLKIIGLLGSFGSRSRHGFGSVTLVKLEEKSLSDSDYQEIVFEKNIKAVLGGFLEKYECWKNSELPPLSAFYQDTRIDIVRFDENNAVDILDKVGKDEQLYRSYGSKNHHKEYKVNGQAPERNFSDDHDLILDFIKNSKNEDKPNTHPRRAIFGLPHNYRYSSGESQRVDASTGRRASPLLQHIHYENNHFSLIQVLLKSEFLPNNQKIKIGKKEVNANVDWQIIEKFMNRGLFNNKETV